AFVDEVVAEAKRAEADALVSTVAEELVVLASATDALAEAGVATWIPDPAAVESCVDKWRFVQTAARAGIAGAATALAEGRDVAELLGAIGLTGPANVQGFVGDDGAHAFTEVNPRFSGGLPLSLAAGADLVGEYLRGVDGLPVRADRLAYREGVTMLRYYEE